MTPLALVALVPALAFTRSLCEPLRLRDLVVTVFVPFPQLRARDQSEHHKNKSGAAIPSPPHNCKLLNLSYLTINLLLAVLPSLDTLMMYIPGASPPTVTLSATSSLCTVTPVIDSSLTLEGRATRIVTLSRAGLG
jgi:hypothetical protein